MSTGKGHDAERRQARIQKILSEIAARAAWERFVRELEDAQEHAQQEVQS
jgi:hypothetical protein